MKSYSFSSQTIAKLQKRTLRGIVSFLVVIFCVVAAIMMWRSPGDRFILLIATIIFGAIAIPLSIRRALKQNREILESVRTELGDDYIARSQIRIPGIQINRQDIKAVDELGTGLCVRTNDKTRTLAIPNALDDDDYKEIRDVLASWAAIRAKPGGSKTQNLLLFFLLMTAFAILIIAPTFWATLVPGVVLVASFGYYYWMLQRTQGVDPRVRRSALLGLIIILFIAGGKLVSFSSAFQAWMGSLGQ